MKEVSYAGVWERGGVLLSDENVPLASSGVEWEVLLLMVLILWRLEAREAGKG